ncbi:hypothetical protein FE257_003487 [Aspergillus nanangensis]|uniref:Zn(2)-C6 fungal-type domain-containing protein n=1 Tax=Aspergillus nanangensis TaxID=2582783 RepID=A0AAD4CBH5_ASPNN|nr:hypothetical protein FE257_003487 [Aspergillus nanangensis]
MSCKPQSFYLLTCKARHTRCDEKKPVCSDCERLGLECRSSEFISHWGPIDQPSSSTTSTIFPSAAAEVDDRGAAPPPLDPPTSTWDIFRLDLPGLKSSSASAHHTSSEASSQSAASAASSSVGMFQPKIPPASPTAIPLTPEMVYLLDEYRRGLARWMDIFDHNCTYQREIARRALSSELLLPCICAFTARQLSLSPSGEIWTPVATNYYARALNLLIKTLNSSAPQENTLSAVILLSSYEVLAAEGQEHRRHYEGAMKLIYTQGISARSFGLDRANFWIWVRHEITVSIMNETPLQMSPKYWNVTWRKGETEEDALGNQILWLVGRVVDWVYGGNGMLSEYYELLRDAEDWYAGLSDAFRGVKYGELEEDQLRKVHFALPAAAAAIIWYHVLHLLLYAEPVLKDAAYAQNVQEHAMEIINISISDIPNEARCFSIVPLYIAGKHVDGVIKKTRIWVLLDNIQSNLGYHTRSRVQALQQLLEPTHRLEWSDAGSPPLPPEQL